MKNETARRKIESLDYYLQNHTNDYGEESHTAMMMAAKALSNSGNPNNVLDKIRAEIQGLRNCSCSCSDGIIDDVEDIIDKYKTESENKE
jgi:hypothetical protein